MAERVLQKQKATLIFTDTQWEDEDNYRFIEDVLNYFDKQGYDYEYVSLSDGRTPLQLFDDEGVLGCDRIPVCSRKLKTEVSLEYVKSQREKGPVTIYFGFDNKEKHRGERVTKRYGELGIDCEYPLMDPPYVLDKLNYIIANWQIAPPRMYGKGFAHANCGGRCVRGKLKHWRHLLRVWPKRFEECAKFEREFKGGKYSFLKDYPLDQLRADVEKQPDLFSGPQGKCFVCFDDDLIDNDP